MGGDCGHGWGYHYDGPSGPCYKCLEDEGKTMLKMKGFDCTFNPGLYLKGIRLGKEYSGKSIVVCGGLYICPFAKHAITVSTHIPHLNIDSKFRAIVWGKWFWIIVPHKDMWLVKGGLG